MGSENNKQLKQGKLMVIGAGFGRTGTSSLCVALEKLLFGKCYHMKTIMFNPGHLKFWEKTMKKNGGAKGVTDEEWKEFFSDYVAGCDLPISSFYKDLARIYPEAKFILTTRDPSSWYNSCISTIAKAMYLSNTFPMNIFHWLRGMGKFTYIMKDIILQDLTLLDWNNEELMKKQFIERNERVKATIPADRLLVFEAKEGWEPLCKFLNLPIPNEPYPKVNDTQEFKAKINFFRAISYVLVLGVPIIIATAAGYYGDYFAKLKRVLL